MSHPFDDLTPDYMLDAVDAAGFLSDGRLLQLNSFENRVYQVGQEDSPPVIVKFYRPQRWSDEQILEEHAFSLFLVERDLPVVAPIEKNGTTLFHCDGFAFAVFRRAGGHAPELDNDNHLEQLGRTLARWHACGSDRVHGMAMPAANCWSRLNSGWLRWNSRSSTCMATAIPATSCGATTAHISWIWTTACAPRPCRTSGCCCPVNRMSNNTNCGCWPAATTPSCPSPGNKPP